MHDIALVRAAPAEFDAALARRGAPPQAALLTALDLDRRAALQRLELLQARRNEASRLIGSARARGDDAAALLAEVGGLKDALPALEADLRGHDAALEAALAALPNRAAPETPDGPDATGNVELRRTGDPATADGAADHVAIGERLGLMDFAAAAKLSGARFVVLRGALARLERALAAFMLDLHTSEFGYTEIAPPLLVRDAAMFGAGQLPKFADDLFHTTSGHWLIPTAEAPLTNLVADGVLDEADLPLRYTAWTPCFRSEAGAAGRDTRGMIRQHQFSKVELVSIVHPAAAAAEHERMTEAAETVLKRLGLPFRTMLLCAGDLGFAARKTYDIEVWLPGQGAYREISSCSDCGDFQARRMGARFRTPGEKGARFVHTLNGSGLAVGRTLVAVLENYCGPDGAVAIPEALRPFMGGLDRIAPP